MKIKIKKFKTTIAGVVMLMALNMPVFAQTASERNTILLNGTWQVAEGKKDVILDRFDHTVQVPGLVSLATPAFVNAGPKVKDRKNISQKDSLREAFWYRRIFSVKGDIPAIAMLKISKAMFGTKVFLNGKDMGDHLPNFTPGYFNVRNAIKAGENELVVRVGASRDAVPLSIPNGFDFEKERYDMSYLLYFPIFIWVIAATGILCLTAFLHILNP